MWSRTPIRMSVWADEWSLNNRIHHQKATGLCDERAQRQQHSTDFVQFEREQSDQRRQAMNSLWLRVDGHCADRNCPHLLRRIRDYPRSASSKLQCKL